VIAVNVAISDEHPQRASTSRAAPVPRTPRLAFSGVPRRWFAGSTAATHVANGVNLLFPAGERFFVRSVRHYLDQLDDPSLVAEVRGFFGQEGRHAQAHERFFETLREQGYDVDAVLKPYEDLAYGRIEKMTSPALRLSVTVALEHFTAILAEDALVAEDLAGAHPVMKQLLEWHALEELEHKAVAFDVLRAVHPSYALRVTGLARGSLVLAGVWVQATRALLAQDGMTLRDAFRELGALRKEGERTGKHVSKPIFTRVFVRGIREYLRPGFHPNDKDHRRIFEETLARLTREGVVADAAETSAV
jgi:predicted metal-dependent hydrolase